MINDYNDNFDVQPEYDFFEGIRGRFYLPENKDIGDCMIGNSSTDMKDFHGLDSKGTKGENTPLY